MFTFEQFALAFSYGFAKSLGLLLLLPTEIFPPLGNLRLVSAFFLSALVAPQFLTMQEMSASAYMCQFVLGMLVALPAYLFIMCAELWGELFDAGRGQSLGSLNDPLSKIESSYMGTFVRALMWLGIVSTGCLDHVISNFTRLDTLPPANNYAIAERVLTLISQCLASTCALVFPFCFLCMLLEIALCYASKLLPGVSLSAEGFTARSLLCMLGLLGMLGFEPFSCLPHLATAFTQPIFS